MTSLSQLGRWLVGATLMLLPGDDLASVARVHLPQRFGAGTSVGLCVLPDLDGDGTADIGVSADFSDPPRLEVLSGATLDVLETYAPADVRPKGAVIGAASHSGWLVARGVRSVESRSYSCRVVGEPSFLEVVELVEGNSWRRRFLLGGGKAFLSDAYLSLSWVDDMNADGVADLAVGVARDEMGWADAGPGGVGSGASTPYFRGLLLYVSGLTGEVLRKIEGPPGFAAKVSCVGDVDGDGWRDLGVLTIAAPRTMGLGENSQPYVQLVSGRTGECSATGRSSSLPLNH